MSFTLLPRGDRLRHSSFVLRHSRQGMTLVEMLVAMALTLMMMAAVVTLFANMSSSVRVRRATIEQNSQLRTARQILETDLAGATCPAIPWGDPGEDLGYFEIIEGECSESAPSYLVRDINGGGLDETDVDATTIDPANSILPRNSLGSNDPEQYFKQPGSLVPGGIGDYDDILSFTVRSNGEPFVGRAEVLRAGGDPMLTQDWMTVSIESDLAEVIWYTVENPADGSLGEPGMRTLYRRVLLIAPWFNGGKLNTLLGGLAFQDHTSAEEFFRRFDISARFDPGDLTTTNDDRWVLNTLGDLTKRENRFAHQYERRDPVAYPAYLYPHRMDDDRIRFRGTGSVSPLHPLGPPWDPDDVVPNRQGQDVVLGDVLAWDVRVFDPGAPLIEDVSGNILEPSDPGWPAAVAAVAAGTGSVVGFGAFVDLGWNYDMARSSYSDPSSRPWSYSRGLTDVPTVGWSYTDYGGTYNRNYGGIFDLYTFYLSNSAPQALFDGARRVGWHPDRPFDNITYGDTHGYPAVYDAWSIHYERDNLNQDRDVDPDNPTVELIDEGTNGFDNRTTDPTGAEASGLFVNGVDDILEKETAPPYDTPLRGLQVKIRVYERDVRRVSAGTVTKNFVPQAQ